MGKRSLIIYSDGACLGNPGPGGAAAIVASPENVIELGEASPKTTNNEMELSGIALALDSILRGEMKNEYDIVEVFIDSQYVLSGIRHWVHGWKRNGWKTSLGEDVKNRPLWERVHEMAEAVEGQCLVFWNHVRGHIGIPGNERCDEIASALAKGEPIVLYRGSRAAYDIELAITKETIAQAASLEPYYLSLIGGVVFRDASWKECEARVKGNRGAKYKKVKSLFEERETLKKWGASEPSSRDVS